MIWSGCHPGLSKTERESRAHLYTFKARMNLRRKCRAVSGVGHSCETTVPKTRSKVSSKGGLFTVTSVSLASLTNRRNHLFSGSEQVRDPASVSRRNTGSVRETMTKISLRCKVKDTRMSAARADADLYIELDLEWISVVFLSSTKKHGIRTVSASRVPSFRQQLWIHFDHDKE